MLPCSFSLGDCREVLRGIPENHFDACVTDPPYELGFMCKSWDSRGVSFQSETWAEVYRVLKPGAHLLAFGGTRTYHRIACAIEDAGFEVRDCIMWLYGQGFPKSLDVGKAIDKMQGAERAVIRANPNHRAISGINYEGIYSGGNTGAINITAPASPEAKQWEGWGTALKPAWEPIILARKPLAGTVAQNVLEHGTGGLNIDGCRIVYQDDIDKSKATPRGKCTSGVLAGGGQDHERQEFIRSKQLGRWPANVILDEEAGQALDEQSGILKSGSRVAGEYKRLGGKDRYSAWEAGPMPEVKGNSGGASRFFYCAKTSPAERNAAGDNRHPTVKPIALMRYLVKLVTPPGGLVLDPFMGSGSTGIAALAEGFLFQGIEQELEYFNLARQRIYNSLRKPVTQCEKAASCY